MKYSIRSAVAIAAFSAAALAACSSSSTSKPGASTTSAGGVTVPSNAVAGTTIQITISDSSGITGPETLVASAATAGVGNVTFVVKNTGTIDHEVVVLKTDVASDKLPITGFDNEPNRVDEKSSQGETGDPPLKPGESRTFTVKNMAAGHYALVCNIAKHYAMGMHAPLAVS